MSKLQPIKKSFESYIKLGYEYNNKYMSRKQLSILKEISSIDDAVLIMDDIFDKSKYRNGKICLYRKIGIQGAILNAEILKAKAIEALIELMKVSKISNENKIKILEKINEFFKNIYLGERIDLRLGNTKKYSPVLLKKYFEMIKLFTGGHIKFGLEIGQLLQNKKIDKKLSKISEHLGVIRQIVDDFNDYFKSHHEIFGDFIGESNRLPELLFKKFKGNRKKALRFVENKEYERAREVILTKEVRKKLFNYCKSELNECNRIKVNFNYNILIEDFEKILSRY